MVNPEPPNLDGSQAWCEIYAAPRELNRMKERDQDTGEVYYDYVCRECSSIVLNIHRTNPGEREKRAPGTSLN
jgi:hypothetical protein